MLPDLNEPLVHFFLVSVLTSRQLASSVRCTLPIPVSDPWYSCSTSLMISRAVRRSAGANGWLSAVKM